MSITLAGQTLPDPNNYQYTSGYRGSGVTMASGAVKFDLVNTSPKRKFTISWKSLTGTQKSAVLAAWASLKTASGTFINYDAASYTVTRDPASPDLTFADLKTGSGVRWAVTIVLLEV